MIPAMASPRQESESLNVEFLVDSMLARVHTLGLTATSITSTNVGSNRHHSGRRVRVEVEGFRSSRKRGGTVAKWRACVETGENFEFETGVRGANGEYC